MNRTAFTYFFLLLVLAATAQLTPEQAVAEMGRGINLGNTLEPPTEGAWNNGPAQEAHFDAYLEAGFTNVRIPVRWDQHTGTTAPFAVDPVWMNRVEQVVDWGLDRGFYITLNGHHEDWLKNNYADPTLRARYDSIWVQISERFQDKSEKLLFEIINEPKGMTVGQVDDLNARILSIIRQTNPTRLVIYGGNEYANAEQLFTAAIPADDYLIGYYHAYDPWPFSGEGQGLWGSSADYVALNNKYQAVADWSASNGVPIHHSEFGARHICDYNSRMRIYAHNVERNLAHGFAFSVWDDGGWFGVLERSDNSWPEVKDILMYYDVDAPNQIFSSQNSDGSVQVVWNNRATDTGSITIERATTTANNFEVVATVPAPAESYTDTDIDANTTYTYRLYTTRADGSLLHGYPTRTITTNGSQPQQSPFNDAPLPLPGPLEVEEYDHGGQDLAYHDADATNTPGDFRANEGVDLAAFNGGYILGYVQQNEWIEYTVDVAQAGLYAVTAEVASEFPDGTFRITADANEASTSFTVPNTDGWVNFQTIEANSPILLGSGVQTLRLTITNGEPFNLDRLTFSLPTATNEATAAAAGFRLAPNPTDGFLYVTFPTTLHGQLELTRPTGESLRVWTVSGTSATLEVSALPPGFYLLHWTQNERRLVRRVVVN